MPKTTKSDLIYQNLRGKIDSGVLSVGQFLPPEKELAKQYGVAVLTLRAALERLRQEGRVSSRRYHGTCIASPERYTPAPSDKVIGLLVPGKIGTLAHPVFSRLVDGFEGALCEAGYMLEVVCYDRANPDHEEILLGKLAQSLCRGWMVPIMNVSDRIWTALRDKQVPIVAAHNRGDQAGIHSFGIDMEALAGAMCAHLQEQGCRHLWILAPPTMHEWQRAVEKAAGAFNGRSHPIASYTVEAGNEAAAQILSSGAPVDAIICADDEIAIGVLEAVNAAKADRRNGGRICVIGGGDFPIGNLSHPPLTTVSYPYFLMGRDAGRLLIDLAKGLKIDLVRCKFNPRFIIRESSLRSSSLV